MLDWPFILPIWFLSAIEFHTIHLWWMKKTFPRKRFRSIFYCFTVNWLERFVPSVSGRQVVWPRRWNGMLCLQCQHHVEASFHRMVPPSAEWSFRVLQILSLCPYTHTFGHDYFLLFWTSSSNINAERTGDSSAYVLSLWFNSMVKSILKFTYLKRSEYQFLIIEYYATPMDHILSDL